MKFFITHLRATRNGLLVMLAVQGGLFLMGVIMVENRVSIEAAMPRNPTSPPKPPHRRIIMTVPAHFHFTNIVPTILPTAACAIIWLAVPGEVSSVGLRSLPTLICILWLCTESRAQP